MELTWLQFLASPFTFPIPHSSSPFTFLVGSWQEASQMIITWPWNVVMVRNGTLLLNGWITIIWFWGTVMAKTLRTGHSYHSLNAIVNLYSSWMSSLYTSIHIRDWYLDKWLVFIFFLWSAFFIWNSILYMMSACKKLTGKGNFWYKIHIF